VLCGWLVCSVVFIFVCWFVCSAVFVCCVGGTGLGRCVTLSKRCIGGGLVGESVGGKEKDAKTWWVIIMSTKTAWIDTIYQPASVSALLSRCTWSGLKGGSTVSTSSPHCMKGKEVRGKDT
jgi:hypothetical protein